jgi:hypothetical protein
VQNFPRRARGRSLYKIWKASGRAGKPPLLEASSGLHARASRRMVIVFGEHCQWSRSERAGNDQPHNDKASEKHLQPIHKLDTTRLIQIPDCV